MVLHNQGCRGREILLTRVGKIFPPQFFAGRGVEGEQPIIGCLEIDSGLPDANTALPDEMTTMIDPVVVPYLLAVSRIERPNMIRNRNVERPVHQQRRTFDCCRRAAPSRTDTGNFVSPLLGDLVHISGRDLGERAVSLATVIAVESSPVVDGRLSDGLRIERDVGCGKRRAAQGSGRDSCAKRSHKSHLSVSRYAVTLCMSSFLRVMTMAWCGASGSFITTSTPGTLSIT